MADPTAPAITADAQTKDAVNTVNVKNLGDMTPFAAGMSSQNALANQQTVTGAISASFQAHLAIMGALTARASGFVLDSSDTAKLATQLADLNSTLASNQQAAKIANTTPPETAVAQQLATLSAVAAQQSQQIAAILATLEAQSKSAAK